MTRQFWANLTLCIVLGALVIFSITQISSALTPKGLFMDDPQPSKEAEAMMQEVVLTQFRLGEDPNKMVKADFVIQNKSVQAIKNIKVLCEFFDAEGAYLDQELWLLAETVPSMNDLKASTISKRFVNTKAQALFCAIRDFQVVKEPAFKLERHVSSGHGEAAESDHGTPASAGH